MTNTIQTTISKEEKTKKELLASVTRKKKKMGDLTTRVEALRVELDIIRHEYNVRVGSLIIKDNKLDLEIIQLRNLKKLIDQGLSLEEALQQEKDTYYNEMLQVEKQEEEIEVERQLLQKKEKEVSPKVEKEVKKLWKKLVVKFHPDLVKDPVEKADREDIIKKINNAYSAHDLQALQYIEKNNTVTSIEDTTISSLEKLLIELENMLLYLEKELLDMQNSEWFGWKTRFKKAKKDNTDIFCDLEKNFLDDIITKTRILRGLKEDLGFYNEMVF